MNTPSNDPESGQLGRQFVDAVSGIFECLGRALICLDRSFRIVHVSSGLDRLIAPGTAETLCGRPASDVLGEELFGVASGFRKALEVGQRREGWGATLGVSGTKPVVVSLTAAPLERFDSVLCDPRVAYLLVLRTPDPADVVGRPSHTMFSGMVARSASMLRIFRLIENLEESDATVLLTGESGTGKEMVARAIHVHSHRSSGPFVAVNCGAIPGELLETELFGHVRGAFTGAVRDRVGRFELASSGTLFLDEVGDLPLPLQVKLLRVLQERTYERVGESRTRQTEARIVAATNADLQRAVVEGRFRDDLYYRLRVVPIEVPPLRERREDIEPLTRHLLARVGARHGRSLILSPDALRVLIKHRWPGNARELENALEFAVAVCRGQTVHARDLPAEVVDPLERRFVDSGGETRRDPGESPGRGGGSERDRIQAALDAHRWSREETANALGMSRTTLWRKMREFGLSRH